MEIWKDIPGYEGKYQVSNIGRVKRLPYKWVHVLKPRGWEKSGKDYLRIDKIAKEKILNFINLDGYNRVSLCDGKQKSSNFLVHRLVYCTFNNIPIKFLGLKTKTLVLHKNDIRNDNRLENLFLGTQKDNIHDMINKGRKKCVRSNKVKIGFGDVENIKNKYKELGSIYKVAPLFGVSYATISRVINGKIWVKKETK